MENSLISIQPHDMLPGAIAFLLSVIQAALSFPLFLKHILRGRYSSRPILIVFFASGLAMQLSWLIYLWPLKNLFINIGLGLHVLASMIFLFQTILLVIKTNN